MNKVVLTKGKKQAYFAVPEDYSLRMIAEDLEDLFINLPNRASFKDVKKKIETFAGLIPIRNKPARPAIEINISRNVGNIVINTELKF